MVEPAVSSIHTYRNADWILAVFNSSSLPLEVLELLNTSTLPNYLQFKRHGFPSKWISFSSEDNEKKRNEQSGIDQVRSPGIFTPSRTFVCSLKEDYSAFPLVRKIVSISNWTSGSGI